MLLQQKNLLTLKSAKNSLANLSIWRYYYLTYHPNLIKADESEPGIIDI